MGLGREKGDPFPSFRAYKAQTWRTYILKYIIGGLLELRTFTLFMTVGDQPAGALFLFLCTFFQLIAGESLQYLNYDSNLLNPSLLCKNSTSTMGKGLYLWLLDYDSCTGKSNRTLNVVYYRSQCVWQFPTLLLSLLEAGHGGREVLSLLLWARGEIKSKGGKDLHVPLTSFTLIRPIIKIKWGIDWCSPLGPFPSLLFLPL